MNADGERLAGRTALVSGGSRGIGRATALRLAREGADVGLLARSAGALAEVEGEIRKLGRRTALAAVDLADSAAATEAVKKLLQELGHLDILVNNAGLTRDNLSVRMSDDEWDMVLDTNLKGAFVLCRAAGRALLKSPAGRVINISSIVGLIGNAGQVNYAAAKAGLLGLTRSLARELAGRGVTVNAICPGWIETDMTSGLSQEIRAQSLASIPLRRFGACEDVAAAAAFLASDDGAYVTGAVLPVDGGWSMG